MTKQTFENDYDIIVFVFALLTRRFQREDNIFAAQCIWWLAGIIQYKEILRFYFEYQVFPSEYIKDCVVTPLPERTSEEIAIPDDDISELDLAEEPITKSSKRNYVEHLSRRKFLPKESSSKSVLNQTRNRKVFRPQKIKQKTLAKKYPGRTNRQLQEIRNSLRKDVLIL